MSRSTNAIAATAIKHKKLLTKGVVLAIDPASGGVSPVGWALFVASKLIKSGTYMPKHRRVGMRLRDIYEYFCKLDLNKYEPDIIIVERLRGRMVPPPLSWSVGVILAAFGYIDPLVEIECPIPSWKAWAGKDHIKGDEADAVAIGSAVISLAELGRPTVSTVIKRKKPTKRVRKKH